MFNKVDDHDDHYQLYNQLEGGSHGASEGEEQEGSAVMENASKRLEFDTAKLSGAVEDVHAYLQEEMEKQGTRGPATIAFKDLDTYVRQKKFRKNEADDGGGVNLEQRNAEIEEAKPKSLSETIVDINIAKIESLFAAHREAHDGESAASIKDGAFKAKLCKSYGGKEGIRDSGMKAFLVENEYYFVTVGLDKHAEKSKSTSILGGTKQENTDKISARSVLTIHKYEPEDFKEPLKLIHEVALNNVQTQIYAQQAKTYAIRGPNLYYFRIDNEHKKRDGKGEVTYRLVKFTFKTQKAEQIRLWTEAAPLDSGKKPLNVCFVAFAKQTIEALEAEETNEDLFSSQIQAQMSARGDRQGTMKGKDTKDMRQSEWLGRASSFLGASAFGKKLTRKGSILAPGPGDLPRASVRGSVSGPIAEEAAKQDEEAFLSQQFIVIAKSHKYHPNVLYSIQRIGNQENGGEKELESLEPKTKNGQRVQLEHIPKKDSTTNAHALDMLSLRVRGEKDTKKEAAWCVLENKDGGEITLAPDDQHNEGNERISSRPWYIFTSKWDHELKKKYLSDHKILNEQHTKFFRDLLQYLDLKIQLARSNSEPMKALRSSLISEVNKYQRSKSQFPPQMLRSSILEHVDSEILKELELEKKYDPESINLVQDTDLGRVLLVYIQENEIFLLQGINKSSYARTERFSPVPVAAREVGFPYHGLQLDARFSNVFLQNHIVESMNSAANGLRAYQTGATKCKYNPKDFNLVLIDKAGKPRLVEDKDKESGKYGKLITSQHRRAYNVYDLFHKEKTWSRRCQFQSDLDQITHIRPILTCEARDENKDEKNQREGIFIELMKYEYESGVEHKSLSRNSSTSQMVTGESTKGAFDNLTLSQSSSIYQISNNRVGQNYQLSAMCENKSIFRILEYRVSSNTKNQDDARLELIGMKLLIPSGKQTQGSAANELYPMLNERQEIVGTQILRRAFPIFAKIEMPNIKGNEFKFRTDLMNATYKRYFSTSGSKGSGEEVNTYLLVEANLSAIMLSRYESFSTGEVNYLLNQGIKTILNMVPHQTSEVLMDVKQFNLFQPLEVLNGQCLCDYLIKKPSELKQRRNELEDEYPKRQSLIEEFAQSAENEQIMEILTSLDLIGNTQVLMADLYQSSPLDRCFDADNVQPASADIIIEYCLNVPKSIQLEKIMMKVMPKVLRSEFPHRKFADFFVNQELIKEELPESEIQCCFTQHLLDSDLPNYSDGTEVLHKLEFSDPKDLALLQHNKTQLDLQRIAGAQIKQENRHRDKGHFTIPINHFLVDTKSLRLQGKIDQLRDGKYDHQKQEWSRKTPIRNKPFSDFDLAVLLMDIQEKYPNEITSMFGVRNLIDNQFVKTEIFFIAQFVLYLCGFVIPYLLQLFYFVEVDSKDQIQAIQTCNIICMATMLVFYAMEILQMRYLGVIPYFASDFYNCVDSASFFTFCYYFQWRMRFPHDMLPQHYMEKVKGSSEDGVTLKNVKWMTEVYNTTLNYKEHQNNNQTLTSIDIKNQIHDEIKDDLGLISIMNCALLLIIGCKVMSYMRINEKMGQLEFLVGQCLYDCSAFIVFFTFWNILFSLFYQVQGVTVDKSGYKDLNIFNRQFLQTYEDSVGNIDVPSYDFWLKTAGGQQGDEKEGTAIMGCMVWLIWATWFLNQWFIFIILLNFVIAIIGQSYDSVMLKSVQNKYFQRTQLNHESRLVLKSLKMKERKDQFLLTANIEDEMAQADEWLGFTQTIKNFVKSENKSLKQNLQHIVSTDLSTSMSMLKTEVEKSLESKIRTELEDVKEDVDEVNYKVDNIQGDVSELKEMMALVLAAQ